MIREATVEDVPRLVEMGKRFIEETAYKDFMEENPTQIEKFVTEMVSRPNAKILVLQKNGTLIGMFCLVFFEHHMSAEPIAGEVFWWVEPEERKGTAGLKLMKRAEQVAVSLGAKKMQMVAPNERIAKIYQRMGYQHLETVFQRSL